MTDRVSAMVRPHRDVAGLLTYIEDAQARAFGWRRGSDCVSFALGAVRAQTGVDLLADIAGWRTRKQARRVAGDLGGLTAAIDARMDRVPLALAKRGDVAGIIDDEFGIRLAIFEGARLVAPSGAGLDRISRDDAAIAWNAESARRVAASEARSDG